MADTKSTSGEGTGQSQEANASFIKTAQDAIGDAVDATLTAVKEHPVAAAAIAAGAAAAVGGAAYAATQLGGEKTDKAEKSKTTTKK